MQAIVLFSGGLDSSLMLALALEKNRDLIALTFDYGQRNRIEIERAKLLAAHYQVEQRIIQIDPSFLLKSALIKGGAPEKDRTLSEIKTGGVPTTYVPGRNTLFLSYALSLAESESANEIYFGANLHDRDGYPDCTPRFIESFQHLIDVVSLKKPRLLTPLMNLTKREILAKANEIHLPVELTWSCYDPVGEKPCERCDACKLRPSSRPDSPIQTL